MELFSAKKTVLLTIFFWVNIILPQEFNVVAQTAKEVSIERVIQEDGSNFGSIYSIWQDNDGFIWIGTAEGSYQYNGYNFRHLKKEEIQANGLVSNIVKDITGKNDEIYFITNEGLSIYNKVFNHFSNFPSKDYFENEPLRCSKLSSTGTLYIGGNSKLYKLENNKITYLGITDDAGRINSIYEDHENNIWIGGEKGCTVFFPKTEKFQSILSPFYDSENITTVNDFFEDDNGMLWTVGKNSNINFIDKEKWKMLTYEQKTGKKLPFDANMLEAFTEDFYGNLWLVTEPSPIYFNKKAFVEGQIDEQCCLKGMYLSEKSMHESYRIIFTDNEGRIWLGSFSGGLYVLDFNLNKTSHYYYKEYKPNHLSHNNINAFAESPEGKIWIGTDGGGLNCFDKNTRVFQTFKYEKNNPKSISGNILLTLAYDSLRNGLWIGHWDNGLDFLDLKTSEFKNYPLKIIDGEKFNQSFYNLIFDNNNNLWAGIPRQGFFLVEPEKGNLIKYDYNDEIKKVEYIAEIGTDHLWIGNINGIYVFDLQEKKFTKKYDASNGLGNNYVNVVHEDSQGRIWVGTQENGLNVLNSKEDTFKTFPEFREINIVGILEDHQNNLWLSAHEGLFRIKVNEKSEIEDLKQFSVSDGLQSNHFKRRSFFKSAESSELYFGGVNGFNVFIPSEMKENTKPPKIFITSLYIQNQLITPNSSDSILEKDISETKELTLKRGQNNITFEYLALNLTNTLNNLYKVKLENFDDDWVDMDHVRKVSYTNLNPGTYRFKVKGTNNDGVWSENEAAISLIILPYWWETLAAKIFYFIFAILAIWLLVRMRLKMLKESNKLLEIKVNERTRELSEKTKETVAQNEELETQQFLLAEQNIELENTIKQLKTTQTQLVQSEKLASLGFLTAGIAHEINNPVNFIKSGIVGLQKSLAKIINLIEQYDDISKENFNEKLIEINLLKEKYKYLTLIDLVKKVTKDIGVGANRTADIVKELRTFARVEGDNLKSTDIHEGINSSLLLLRNQYRGRINIKKNYGKIPKFYCFPGKLNQVFMNLLVNSIQAIEEEGEITITTFTENKELCISFSDNGHGMNPEIQQHIFEPFFSTKDEGKGTGLGLSISLSIIQQHKGKIEIESKEGKGSIVTLRFPLSTNSAKRTNNAPQ